MNYRTAKAFNLAYSGIMLVVSAFVTLQLISLSAEEGISRAYLWFYIPLGLFCCLFAGLSLVFTIIKGDPETANIAFIAETSEARPLSRNILARFGLIILFCVVIAGSITFAGMQFLPVPQATQTGFQMTEAKSDYLISVVPGLFEDFAFLLFLPCLLVMLFCLLSKWLLKMDPKQNVAFFLIVILFSCLLSSAGYGIWVVPGFTSSHTIYGENVPAYIYAFVYGFTQSTLYQVTGIFLPIAHPLHNYMISKMERTRISIGGEA